MARTVYAIWLCGAGGKRFRGYSGNIQNLRVSEEQHLRLCFADSCAAEDATLDDEQQPLRELMVIKHSSFAENIVGLAFARLTKVYASRLDSLSLEQRVVPPVNKCCSSVSR